jgi:hypothetical protein
MGTKKKEKENPLEPPTHNVKKLGMIIPTNVLQ